MDINKTEVYHVGKPDDEEQKEGAGRDVSPLTSITSQMYKDRVYTPDEYALFMKRLMEMNNDLRDSGGDADKNIGTDCDAHEMTELPIKVRVPKAIARFLEETDKEKAAAGIEAVCSSYLVAATLASRPAKVSFPEAIYRIVLMSEKGRRGGPAT